MCGIAGYQGSFDDSLLGKMSDVIAHRGPDDNGAFLDGDSQTGLAHRRLSIIDLSAAGHQPMCDANDRATIVYNGELYNFRELRAELETAGVHFRTQCDTEVLIHLYLERGVEMVSSLNGIFAFAIWDRSDGSLFLTRDQLGIKPLYYSVDSRGVLFASEMKAILQDPTVDRTIDANAVRDYLTYLYCPSPRTMLKSVHKLEAGHAMIVRQGRVDRQWQYYDLPYDQPIEPLTECEAITLVRDQIRIAVERQMIADVPVGAFLSGGLDSSAVTAFAQQHVGDRPLECFTIGFDEDTQEGIPADLPYARNVAEHLGVRLHTVEINPDIAELLEFMVYHLDEPQPDPACINVWLISQLARERGMKVLLSGAGGDDIFTGYRRHYALQQEYLWTWLPRSVRRMMRAGSQGLSKSKSSTRRLAKLLAYADGTADERIMGYFHWIQQKELQRLLGPAVRDEMSDGFSPSLESALANCPTDVALNRMLYLDSKHFLTDHNLNYTDKMAMAASVEVRVPLLDIDLISLAARLPINLKQRGRTGKYIFKRAMEGILPNEVIYRPKSGFGAPLRMWIRNDLRPLVDELLSRRVIESRGIFDADGVADVLRRDRDGQIDAAYPIFGMMCIELWCRMFLDQIPRAPAIPGHVAA